jgi:ubiquinone/menaquinone biosynthesis C-methylase UbiE
MSEPSKFAYVGEELEIFAEARNWKDYWSSRIKKYLRGDVLEVGAGLGANTRLLRTNQQQRWVCLEPDAELLKQLRSSLARQPKLAHCEFVEGTVANLNSRDRFDALLYIDVLEHIADDRHELIQAANYLKPGGRLMVLSPAHAWLFSKFDAAIGHFRRYNKRALECLAPPTLQLEKMLYLDCCGLFVSLGNRFLLRQPLPTLRQILFWDRFVVPASRVLDPVLGFKIGKSILGIWTKACP